jgi:hypothetical protein
MLTGNRMKRALTAGLVAAALLVAPAGLSFTTTGTAYAARAITSPGGGTHPTTTATGGSNVGQVKGESDGEPGSLDNAGCAWMADRIGEYAQAAEDATDPKSRQANADMAAGLAVEGGDMGCTFTYS